MFKASVYIVFYILGGVVTALALAAVTAVVIALPVMWLWNAVVPSLFNLPEIGFWQAMGLQMLCDLLFKTTRATTSESSKENFKSNISRHYYS